MIAINWEAVGGDTLDLQTLFSADDLAKMQAGTVAGAQKAVADRISVWDAATDTYTDYFLRKNGQGVIQGWALYNGNNIPDTIPVAKGSAFWFYRQAASDIEVTIKGEVSNDASVTFAIKGANGCAGYNMIGAGFPVDLMLNETEFGWTTGKAGTVAGAQKAVADRISIWDPSNDSYTDYFLRKNGQNVVQGWANYNGNTIEEDAKIPAGAAAWYFRQEASDITISEATPLN